MNTYQIAVLPGDGIGPEVMQEALKVLQAVESKFQFKTSLTSCHVGGAAIDNCGHPLPPETLAVCDASDAILFGSVGGPKWDNLPADQRPERGALLPLRKHFSLYANLRPGICLQELSTASPLKKELLEGGLDILCVRELTGGMYFGEPKFYGERDGEIIGIDTLFYRKSEVTRIARVAFEAAMGRGKRLCSVDKANVLSSSIMWRDAVEEVAKDFPEVELSHMYVDNAAMQLVRNPQYFDVMVTENTFGDILSDEMAIICGSLGMLPSASLGECREGSRFFGLYEPSGGSAPDIAGQNIANPIAQILSLGMLLRYSCGEAAAADTIDAAVKSVIAAGYRTRDLYTGAETEQCVSTSAMGDAIVAAIA